jgi:DNA-directed RNA polymerase subunit RPC12/RpoP
MNEASIVMTSRMHTPHTTCPSCHEEVFLDELVGGRCPLCGYSLDEDDGMCSEYEETLERSDLGWMIFQFFVFKWFCTEGASPLQVRRILTRYEDLAQCNPDDAEMMEFALEVSMSRWERLLPKRCSRCGRIFLSGGKAVISGDFSSPECLREYICPSCS